MPNLARIMNVRTSFQIQANQDASQRLSRHETYKQSLGEINAIDPILAERIKYLLILSY